MVARFSAPVQTGNGAHSASCTMGTGSFPGVKDGRGVTLTAQPLLVLWSWRGRVIPLLPQWAVRLVRSLNAWTRVYFTFTLLLGNSILRIVFVNQPFVLKYCHSNQKRKHETQGSFVADRLYLVCKPNNHDLYDVRVNQSTIEMLLSRSFEYNCVGVQIGVRGGAFGWGIVVQAER